MIYLDNASTTPIDPEVLDVMIDYMRNEYGNPSSKYYPQAINAQKALLKARNQVANLLGCDSEHIIFTSGSTESNNFIIKGVAEKYKSKGNHIITSKIEHKSILKTCEHLSKLGYKITYVDTDEYGRVNIDQIKNVITKDTILVSIMWANNEIGTINDIELISRICKDSKVLFHTDATQVIGNIDINVALSGVDFLSMSAHKIYGPKGIGVAYIGPDRLGLRHRLPSLIDGGDQEYKLRAGTHSMHNIIGLGKATEIANRDMHTYINEIEINEKQLKDALIKLKPDITFNGDQKNKVPGLLSINIPGINNELFCKQISNELACSTGSACSISEGSYVLKSINNLDSSSTIRIKLSKFTPISSISNIANIICK